MQRYTKKSMVSGSKSIGLVLFILALMVFDHALSSTLPDSIDRIRYGVVGVGTIIPVPHSAAKRPDANFRGTGFVVGNGQLVITNHHVIPEKLDHKRRESHAVFVGRGKLAVARTVKIVAMDPKHDLALLEIEGTPLKPIELEEDDHVREGQEVAFTGFPLGMALGLYPVTNKTIVSAITPIVIPANSSRNLTAAQINRLKSPYEVYQLDAIAYPGNSGSPVYRIGTGKVIGVVNSVFVKGTKESMLETPSGISYAIPVSYIRDLLRKYRSKEKKGR